MIWLWVLPVAWTVCGLVVVGVFHASGEHLPPESVDDLDRRWPEGWTVCDHDGMAVLHSIRYQHEEAS